MLAGGSTVSRGLSPLGLVAGIVTASGGLGTW